MNTANWKSALSPQQFAVVAAINGTDDSLCVVARAGCGKTHLLIRGVVREIVETMPRAEVALMAYNKSAAQEFKDRLAGFAKETGNPDFVSWKRVQAGTVHSFGNSIVRKAFPRTQVDKDKVLKICDELAAREVDPQASVFSIESATIKHLVGLGKQSAIGFVTGVEDRKAWYDLVEHHGVNDTLSDDTTVDDLVTAAIAVLRRSIALDREVIDFDDMVLAPLVHKMRIWPKDFVIIDEAQDTNAARRALALAMLKPKTGRLIVVGDDRQAIYGFTGADADSLELIASTVNAKRFPLTVTYRCPKTVVLEANRLVPDLVAHESAPEGRVSAMTLATTVEVEGQPTKIEHWYMRANLAKTDAILCRNTKPLVECAYALLAAGIGCRVEGRDIGEGLVKLATRWKRVKALSALAEKLEDYRQREMTKWLGKGREDRAQATEDKVTSLLTIIDSLQKNGQNEVAALVDWIRSLFSDTDPGQPVKVVTLSTIHKSKGREWERVFILKRNETLPSKYARKPWQLLQESNLEYVAITRAKTELIYVD